MQVIKKISKQQALEQAYTNLYNSKLSEVDKNLKVLIKVKKYLATHKHEKSQTKKPNN